MNSREGFVAAYADSIRKWRNSYTKTYLPTHRKWQKCPKHIFGVANGFVV